MHILCGFELSHIPETRRILESLGEVRYLDYDRAALAELLPEVDVLYTSLKVRVDRELLEQAPRLRCIATPSTGTDHLDLRAAEELGIPVLSLKEEIAFLRSVTATAELAFALILAAMRNLPFAFDAVRAGEWESRRFRGHQVYEKTLGIIGYGRLGEMMGRYGLAFGMRVLACDPYKTIAEPGIEQVDLDTLLHQADVVTVHVHLNNETRGLLSHREFALMKPGAYLVNTSRGAIIDDDAFLRALESGRLAGAGVDVLAGELDGPIGDHPLVQYARAHSNLVITPHMGGVTFESQEKAFAYTAKMLEAFLKAC